MHIAFLTLYLGLASGRMPIELAVTGQGPIATIELVLDGAPAGRLSGPPWKGEIDLGKPLLPHHLEARGLDGQGAEVARTEQWLNLAQPPAALDLVPEPGPEGRIAAVRLTFYSVTHDLPSKVTATLDGSPLPVTEDRVTLPAYRPDLPHLLAVEAVYPRGTSAHRDLAFGGGLSGEVATDLTAVLVRTRGPLLPPVQELRGWFTERGQALTPVAVEEGPAEILIVREPKAEQLLINVGRRGTHNGFDSLLQFELPLVADVRFRFIDTSVDWFSGKTGSSGLFNFSDELDSRRGGLYWQLSRASFVHESGPPHVADAVAVSGVRLLGEQRRRAVLLVLADGTDHSRYDAAAVRRYLTAIRVPLYVWSLRPPPYPAAIAAWGEVEPISTVSQLRRAYERLGRDLAAQRIVLLDGRHLPRAIVLSPAAKGTLELVAGPDR